MSCEASTRGSRMVTTSTNPEIQVERSRICLAFPASIQHFPSHAQPPIPRRPFSDSVPWVGAFTVLEYCSCEAASRVPLEIPQTIRYTVRFKVPNFVMECTSVALSEFLEPNTYRFFVPRFSSPDHFSQQVGKNAILTDPRESYIGSQLGFAILRAVSTRKSRMRVFGALPVIVTFRKFNLKKYANPEQSL